MVASQAAGAASSTIRGDICAFKWLKAENKMQRFSLKRFVNARQFD
jgi:hypothetical protein